MARFSILSICLVAVASASMVSATDTSFLQFQQFMMKFNKTYESPEEMSYRLSVFRQSLARAERMNAQENDEQVFGITKVCRTYECTIQICFVPLFSLPLIMLHSSTPLLAIYSFLI